MIAIMATQDRALIQVVSKTISIIVALSKSSKTARELSEMTGISKPAVYRILHTLELGNFVSQKNSKREFALTPYFNALTKKETGQYDRLISIAIPHLISLNNKFDETINLGLIINKRVNYLYCIESSQRLRSGNPTHDKDFIHSTALGKAFLSGMSKDKGQVLIKRLDFRKLTPRTVNTPEELEKLIVRIQKAGYAVDDQENEIGSRCVGVPIFNSEQEPIAALSVSGPVSRMDAEKIKIIGQSLITSAKAISSNL
jgi:IclR family acetate operon transcriptional repressor